MDGLGNGGKWELCVNYAVKHSQGETIFGDITEVSMKILVAYLYLIKESRLWGLCSVEFMNVLEWYFRSPPS